MGGMTSVPSYTDVELPGQRVTSTTLQTVVMRYVVAGEMASGRRVLELGCGPGIGLEYLQKCGASDVTGADRDAGLLRMARGQTSADLSLVQCDAMRLPFKQGAFDVVLLLEVFMYLSDPVAVLRDIGRVLDVGGTVLLSMPNGVTLGVPPSGAIVRFYSGGEVGELLREAGFAPEVFGVFPFREGAEEKATLQRMASRVLDGMERCGFPAGLRTRLTSVVLRKNCQLPVRIQSSHRQLLCEGEQGMERLFGAPDECRVLYARGVAAHR
jgi:SAM-dependent methyltransferase